jgi:4'-phosphopantetheinyl transferase
VLPAASEVHVWALDLERAPANLAHALTSAELRTAETAGARWAVARAGLRAVLGSYLDVDPSGLRLDERAKPRLEPPSPLRFNLSHAGDVALVVVATEREVGVDVEEVRRQRDPDGLMRHSLLSAERAAVEEAADPVRAFHLHWVAKEALVKALGRGVTSMRSFEVSLDGPGGPRVVHVANDLEEGRRWTLHPLEVADPYVAAVVVEGEARVAPLRVFEP